MAENILEVVGLNKNFGGIFVTQNVDFKMARGEKVAIIGPNGAGKSTFFNLLTGYHAPDSGKVLFDGKDITNWPEHAIVRIGISRAFQVSNIFPRLTVNENVRCAVHSHLGKAMNMFSSATKVGVEETMEVLQLCGLADKVKIMAGELSQGDKKKLELAIALASQPKLLFLDEPTAGMSLEETHETMELVDFLNRDLNLSILFTEHDMSVIFNHAQRVTLLHRGQIIVEGSPDEVRDNETAKKIYLGEQHL
jgi:branched-chain amino acid transport system ATP-binding protein